MNKDLKIRYVADDSSVIRATKRIDAAHASLESKLKRVGTGMKQVGGLMTRALTLPIVGAAVASVKLATDFEESMDKIRGLVGVGRKQVERFSEAILEMAKTLPTSPKELADALFFITSAGLRGAKALDVLRMSAKASAAGLGDVKTVADAVTSALNAYHGTGLKASTITDTLVAAVRAGKMPVDALAGAIGSVLGPAAELGVSFQEVAGTGAALSRVGVPVNKTMTGLRFLMIGLAKPTSKASAILKDVGLSADDVRKSIRDRGLLKTLQELKDKLPIDKFLDVVGGARGVVTALGLVGKNAAQVRDVMRAVRDSTGDTTKAFNVQSQSLRNKMKTAFSALQVAGIKVGNVLLPYLKQFAEWVGKLADKFSNLSPHAQKMIMLIAGVAAVVGPLIVVLGTLASALAVLLSPVGLVILAIVALVAVGVLLWKNWKTVEKVAAEVWGTIMHVIGLALGFMLEGFRQFIRFFVIDFAGAMVHGAAVAFGWIPGIGGKIKDAAKKFDAWSSGILHNLDVQIAKFKHWGDELTGQLVRVGNTAVYASNALSVITTPGSTTLHGTSRRGRGGSSTTIKQPPHFAAGVRGFRGGLAVVGEYGPELVRLPAGSDVYPKAAMAGVSGSGGLGLVGLAIAGTLDTPWGPAKLRGVVREEIAAHDRFNRRVARMGGAA